MRIFFQLKNTLCKTLTIALGISAIFFMSCNQNQDIAKPLGEVRLEYPTPVYKPFNESAPYRLLYSNFAQIKPGKQPNWFVIHYPKMKANIYLTYIPVHSKADLVVQIKESERFVQEQTVKASFISPQTFEFPDKKVFGTMYELGGESAINFKFHATDSLRHFLTGSVYFSTNPKPDSLAPAVNYLKNDVKKLIETIEWVK